MQSREKIKQQKSLIENTKFLDDVDKMLEHVDLLTIETYQQVLEENLPQIVMNYQSQNEEENSEDKKDMVRKYKTNLLTNVELEVASCLKSNLSMQLTNYIQNSQYCIQRHFHCQSTNLFDPFIDFPAKFDLKDECFINEPVKFNFSLSPRNIQERFKGRKILPFLNPVTESWSSRLKIIITAAAVINESQLAIAGLVLKCFGSSKAAIRIATSIGLVYCGLYLFERTIWALNGKEKQIKMAVLAFANDKLSLLMSCVTSSMKSQVQYQMKTFLDSVLDSIEANHVELQANIERINDESEGIQFVIKSCANLSNSLQGVLFELDAFERTLWNKLEKKHVKSQDF